MKDFIENCTEMTSKKIKIGIMGGTFDPIHYGHLVAAEAARVKFDLKDVIFVPSGNPPHKKGQKVLDKTHRYLMTLLATATNPYFQVSRNEVDREGYTYTIDTIRDFDIEYNGTAEFYFITGADALSEVLTWKNIEKLFEMCQFVAATRPGYKYEELFKEIEYLTVNYNGRIHFVEVPSLAISSTDIRERVRMDLPIKYLLSEAVENYIYKNNLYK
ncbi:nicotinate-nucleotide adenylyltransferase [Petroclostridium sp. X23]|uniref:nicotinate-nucleotide adenylyltransferase n=1 Tax=Petroclostridium sp. X23 TaxID=3045146 RepID=UPI0024ADE6B2|nr:nicotinate-nucleotide adenylyltransferase [Petroclostridium sp. X23]WHH58420.1 nicotinate-nucleotide adenylyltransferase [Petroclostridium sp. X23]